MGNQSRAKVYEQNAAGGGGGAIEVGGVDGTGSTICELGGCIEDHFMEPMVIDISSVARHAYEEAQQKNREMGNQSQVPAPIDRKTPPKTHRQIGFQRPFSKDQIRAWIVHGINYSLFYALASVLFQTRTNDSNRATPFFGISLIGFHILCVGFFLFSWVSCELVECTDEISNKKWLGICLTGERWLRQRYCAICRRRVVGLDHHCNWLHTCIGQANYAQFFSVVMFGTLQFYIQVLVTSLFLTSWSEDIRKRVGDNMYWHFQGFNITCLVLSLICSISYSILLGFHIYLTCRDVGTYEWLLVRRKQKKERAGKRATSTTSATNSGTTTTQPN